MPVRLPRLDLAAERRGVRVPWTDYPGIVVILARMNNPAMWEWKGGPDGQERLRELRLAMRPDEAAERWAREAMAHTVLLGWEGIADDETGAELPYSVEKAIEFLTDPRRYPFFDFVFRESMEMGRFLERNQMDAEKNSGSA